MLAVSMRRYPQRRASGLSQTQGAAWPGHQGASAGHASEPYGSISRRAQGRQQGSRPIPWQQLWPSIRDTNKRCPAQVRCGTRASRVAVYASAGLTLLLTPPRRARATRPAGEQAAQGTKGGGRRKPGEPVGQPMRSGAAREVREAGGRAAHVPRPRSRPCTGRGPASGSPALHAGPEWTRSSGPQTWPASRVAVRWTSGCPGTGG